MIRQGERRRLRTAGAFTLIELIVVMIIMAALAALIAPGMARIYQGIKLDTGVRSFRTLADEARQQAASSRSVCRLAIHPGWREISLQARNSKLIASPKEAVERIKRAEGLGDGAGTRFEDMEGVSRRMLLPEGVEIRYIAVSGRRQSPGQELFIDFAPFRQADEIDFAFRNGLKDYKGLRIEAGSGIAKDLQVAVDD